MQTEPIKQEIAAMVGPMEAKYGAGKAALMPVLQKVQQKYRYVPREAIKEIAQQLKVFESDIYGVITFYAQFRQNPVGDHIIKVCKGTACHVGGAETVAEAVSDILGITVDETTEDKKFTMEYVACLGCCSLAPVMMIDDAVYGHLTKAKIKQVLNSYGNKNVN